MLRKRLSSHSVGEGGILSSNSQELEKKTSSSPQHLQLGVATSASASAGAGNMDIHANYPGHVTFEARHRKMSRSCCAHIFYTRVLKQGTKSRPSLSPLHKLRPQRRLKCILLTVLLLLCCTITITCVHDFLFGIHPLPGGMIGRFIDCRIRAVLWGRTLSQAQRELEGKNIHLPVSSDGGSSAQVKTMPHATLRELIGRATKRKELLKLLMDFGSMYVQQLAGEGSSEWCSDAKLPRIIVRPRNLWDRPYVNSYNIFSYGDVDVGGKENDVSVGMNLQLEFLDIDRGDMDGFLQDFSFQKAIAHHHDDDWDSGVHSLSTFHDMYKIMGEKKYRFREEFWSIYFLYKFGGVYINTHAHEGTTDVNQGMPSILNFVQSFDSSQTCEEMGVVTVQNGSLQTFAAAPGHSLLKCILDQVSEEWQSVSTRASDGNAERFGDDEEHCGGSTPGFCMSPFNTLLAAISTEEELKNVNVGISTVRTISLVSQHQCPKKLTSVLNRNAQNTGGDSDGASLTSSSLIDEEKKVSMSTTWNEDQADSALKYVVKTTLDEKMQHQSKFCTGMWMWPCHRCLKSATHGTHTKCDFLCQPCFDDLFFDHIQGHNVDGADILPINVQVRGFKGHSQTQQKQQYPSKMIPRIIHQTWSENLSPIHNPQLYRLQNTWRASSTYASKSPSTPGWSYKFYTDDEAREYIAQHFPPPIPFLEAYDALIPGAYKADLFRYLVLMNEGGIYADIDVMLDGGSSSLDGFISPFMSFFAPRDAVAEYANGQYCLWNGLIGAAPGHPIIVRAVERLVNLILRRADLLDIEQDVLASKAGSRDTEIWKVRAVQELVLSGPCALGIALNEAMGNDPVARIDVGWLEVEETMKKKKENYAHDLGDVMILTTDKDDLGAMRFTDVERNIMFASTDMPGLTKDRLETIGDDDSDRSTTDPTLGYVRKITSMEKKERKTNPHYKISGRGSWLWGTRGVYKDELMSTRSVAMHLQFLD